MRLSNDFTIRTLQEKLSNIKKKNLCLTLTLFFAVILAAGLIIFLAVKIYRERCDCWDDEDSYDDYAEAEDGSHMAENTEDKNLSEEP